MLGYLMYVPFKNDDKSICIHLYLIEASFAGDSGCIPTVANAHQLPS